MATKGWLDFDLDASDPSILFRHSLKERLETSDANGNWSSVDVGNSTVSMDSVDANVHGHWPTHDSELGMRAISETDGATDCGYRLTTGSGIDSLDQEGQMCFEIETYWLADNDSTRS